MFCRSCHYDLRGSAEPHRWWIKPSHFGSTGFFHDYFNDVLLIPIFLPPVLWLHRRLGMRNHDRPPTIVETAFHVAAWSVCFLLIFPQFPWLYQHSTADPWNAAAYAVGGAVAWVIWRWSPSLRIVRSRFRAD
jgi:hypothetical protein